MSDTTTPKLFADIHAEEIREVERQRVNRLSDPADAESNLIGLAISGGGIRSATFGLGVLQELRRQGLLKVVDYLSTVSGGGYIGSWFASNRLRQGMEKSKEDLRNPDFLMDEHDSVRHLRRFSRYLTPKTGFLSSDTWTAISIWLRNTLSIQFLLLVFLTLVMLLPYGADYLFRMVVTSHFEGTFPGFRVALWCVFAAGGISLVCLAFQRRRDIVGFRLEAAQVFLTLFSAYLLAPLIWSEEFQIQQGGTKDWNYVLKLAIFLAAMTVINRLWCLDYPKFLAPKKQRILFRTSWLVLSLLIQALVVVAAGLVCGLTLFHVMDLVQPDWVQSGLTKEVRLATVSQFSGAFYPFELARVAVRTLAYIATEWAVIVGGPLVVLTYALLIGTGVSLSGSDTHDRFREWWARLGGWLFILSLGLLVLELVALKGPELVENMLSAKGRIGALGAWLVTSGIGAKLAGSADTSGTKEGSPVKEKLLSLAPLIFFTGLMLAVACLTKWLVATTREFWPATSKFPAWVPEWISGSPLICLALALTVLLLILISHFDINELSMNLFYRNRLMRCYLGASRRQAERKPATFTGFDFGDDVNLVDYQTQKSATYPGPFWIVNTALNTSKNPDLDVAERLAESFVLTSLNSGFQRRGLGVGNSGERPEQGYRCTEEYMDGSIGAAAAVSISGAAASPNSGYHTSPLIAFMLTVFNARLGWWSANPAAEKSWRDERPPFYKGMSWYVLKELFGGASVSDPFVYLSDGGHFENLGLYELVRRRCRLIIVSDGEEDGGYTFHALGTAIRRCWVDFGVRIEVDTSSISPGTPGGPCRGHCAIGTIHYPKANGGITEATLIYLKSSWTGDEPTDLQQYRAANPAFPHESTGDQFFSESQFESYRKLGAHVAHTCLNPTMEYLAKCRSLEALTPAGRLNVTALIDKLSGALQDYWKPLNEGEGSDFIRNTEMLVGIWRDVQRDPALEWMVPIILPVQGTNFSDSCLPAQENPKPASGPETQSGRIICQRLFQLMENVYLDLDLARTTFEDDNSGWINLFRYWASFGFVGGEWEIAKDTFGSRFGAFWEQRLKPHSAPPPHGPAVDPSDVVHHV